MPEIINKKDIDKKNLEDQVAFYKKHFQYQHCELDGCGHEVRDSWVLYDGELYCDSCFDWLIDNQKEEAGNEIKRMETEIAKLKADFKLD